MRVLIWPEKTFEEFGSRRFDVKTELVKKSAMGKDDIDIDSDLEYVHMPTTTRAKAMENALKLLRHDRIAFGSVRVQEQAVDWYEESDRVAEWSDVGDAEEFCIEDFVVRP